MKPLTVADLLVWREADALAERNKSLCDTLEAAGFRDAADQLRRATESIPALIAEGYGRGVNADCLRFLRMARGSNLEVESHLRTNMRLGRLDRDSALEAIGHTLRVRYLLKRFAESVERRMRVNEETKKAQRKRTSA